MKNSFFPSTLGGMFAYLRSFFRRLQSSKNPSYDLDIILSQANPEANIYERLSWFVDLMQWARYKSYLLDPKEIANVRLPQVRMKFLIQLLDRNLEWKKSVSLCLRSILRDTRDVELFASTGLAEDQSFWSELFSRLYTKILPNKPLSEGGIQVLNEIFPDPQDLEWFSSMTPELMQSLIDLVLYEIRPEEDFTALINDIEEALLILSAQVSAIGTSYPVRRRVGKVSIVEMPFAGLHLQTEILIASFGDSSEDQMFQHVLRYKQTLAECAEVFNEVYRHLDEHGVSTKVVYLLELAHGKIKRMNSLVDLLAKPKVEAKPLILFISELIEENQKQHGILHLLEQNTHLLSKKIVERSAETGEDYIARNKAEYNNMFRKALGGGAYTSVTVLFKVFIHALKLPEFLQGFLFSLNYAFSFVAIQLSGFTLATKQPAMTAPALASKLQKVRIGDSVEPLVEEVIQLVRTQFVGVFGNVLMVAPCLILLDIIVQFSIGNHVLVSESKAENLLNTSNLLSFAPLFAAFTGILLWLSSVVAGYIDNWFYLNKMRSTILYNRRINYILGNKATQGIANFLEKNISGIAGNVSLGFFLGLLPEINSFLGIFLDIRHVTLSAGNFALGAMFFSWDVFSRWDFWLSLVGLFVVGCLNIAVSFAMAFFVALKSRKISRVKQYQVYWAVLRRFRKNPLCFFFPPKDS